MVQENTSAIIVTGCSGGIGRALVERFAESGYKTIGIDCSNGNAKVDVFFQIDLEKLIGNHEEQKKLVVGVEKALGKHKLSCIVNNAAVQLMGGVIDLSIDDFRKSMDVNVVAPFLLSKMFYFHLRESRGSILNIGSIHSRLTKPGFVGYATSKGALESLTRSMAVDVGQYISVYAILPAAISTEMLLEGFKTKPQRYALLEKCHPVQKVGSPGDVADLACYLVKAHNAFLNGTVIDLSGGISSRLHDPV